MVAEQAANNDVILLIAKLRRENIVLGYTYVAIVSAMLAGIVYHKIVGIYTCQLHIYTFAVCPVGYTCKRIAAAATNVGYTYSLGFIVYRLGKRGEMVNGKGKKFSSHLSLFILLLFIFKLIYASLKKSSIRIYIHYTSP